MPVDRFAANKRRDRVRAEEEREHDSSGWTALKIGWLENNRRSRDFVEETLALLDARTEERWESARKRYRQMLTWLKEDQYRVLSPETRDRMGRLQGMLLALQSGKLDMATLPDRPTRDRAHAPRRKQSHADLPDWLNGARPPVPVPPPKRSTDK